MAQPPLRAFVLVCLALLLVAYFEAGVVEGSSQKHTPSVQAKSSTVVENGGDEPSNIEIHYQTELVGKEGLENIPALLKELGLGADPSIAGNSGNSISLGFGDSSLDWGFEQFNKLQNLQSAVFFSPFLVQGAPERLTSTSFLGPTGQDQSAVLREQMLQNVAASRFGPAVMAAKKQDSDNMMPSDAEDQSWDIEVIFVPSDPVFKNEDGDSTNSQFLILDEGSLEDQDGHEVVSHRSKRSSLLCSIAFVTLLIGCILTLLLCVRQGCELRRAMKDTAQKAGEMSFRGVYERRPLLSDIDKAFEADDDGYTNVLIKPVDCEPAIKSHYPAYLKAQN